MIKSLIVMSLVPPLTAQPSAEILNNFNNTIKINENENLNKNLYSINEKTNKEIKIAGSWMSAGSAGVAGWFNGRPETKTLKSKKININKSIANGKHDVISKFKQIKVSGMWRAFNNYKYGALDFQWGNLYKEPYKDIELLVSLDDQINDWMQYDYIEWDVNSGKYYNNVTFNIKISFDSKWENLILDTEIIARARIGGVAYAAYTYVSGTVSNLAFISRKSTEYISNLKTNDVKINLNQLEGTSDSKLKESIILDIGKQNFNSSTIKDIVVDVVRNPNQWSISGIKFEIPKIGRYKEYAAKFLANSNNLKYDGFIAVNVILENKELWRIREWATLQ